MHILRPVQIAIFFTTICIHLISRSLNYSSNLLSCFDDMTAYDLTYQIQREYLPLHKNYLCEQEQQAINLYALCYNQVVSTENSQTMYSKFGHTLALLFRPNVMPPEDFVEIHNTQCEDFESTLISINDTEESEQI